MAVNNTPSNEYIDFGTVVTKTTLSEIAKRGVSSEIESIGDGTRIQITLMKSGKRLRLIQKETNDVPTFWSKVANTREWDSIPQGKRPRGIVTDLYVCMIAVLQDLAEYYQKSVSYTLSTNHKKMIYWMDENKHLFPITSQRWEGKFLKVESVFEPKSVMRR